MYTIQVRNIRPEEIPEVVRVEEEAWPEEMRATREKFASRMEIFPSGFFGTYVDGKLVGVSTSIIINYNPNEKAAWNWYDITGNGFGTTHTPNGNALYVVSLGVSQGNYMEPVRGYLKSNGTPSLGTQLIDEQKRLARRLGKEYLLLTARAPGYREAWERNGQSLDIERYLAMTVEKNGAVEPLDPEIRFYRRCGLDIARIVPEAEEDIASMNYGVVMHWKVD